MCLNAINDRTVAMATPMMVTQWAPALPMIFPKSPATMAPMSGARTVQR
jgi:hypothetical protein